MQAVSHWQPHVAALDDDPAVRELLAEYLSGNDLRVTTLASGRELDATLARDPIDLLVLDLKLAGEDGMQIARRLRESTSSLPILMLTGRSEEADRVMGLELGADDYLTKPFSLAELLARVKALLRRADLLRAAQAAAAGSSGALRNGELEIQPTKRQVRCRGASIDFTALEFDLLLYFAQHPGHVFSRGQLLDAVWGYTHDGYEHTVTTHINRLRAKLEADPMRPQLILTVRGAGYKMRDVPR